MYKNVGRKFLYLIEWPYSEDSYYIDGAYVF
jgi:hypothetical protein